MDIDDFDIPDIEELINESNQEQSINKSIDKSTEKKPEIKLVTKKTLDLYYRHAFPFQLFFKWLGNNNSGKLTKL